MFSNTVSLGDVALIVTFILSFVGAAFRLERRLTRVETMLEMHLANPGPAKKP